MGDPWTCWIRIVDGEMGGGTNTQVVDPVRANRQSIDPLHPPLGYVLRCVRSHVMFRPTRVHSNLAVSRLLGLVSTDEHHKFDATNACTTGLPSPSFPLIVCVEGGALAINLPASSLHSTRTKSIPWTDGAYEYVTAILVDPSQGANRLPHRFSSVPQHWHWFWEPIKIR